MGAQTSVGFGGQLQCWKRRRQLRSVVAAGIACVIVALHWGNEDLLGWIALAFLIALAAFDVFVLADREVKAVSSAAASERTSGERRSWLVIELFAYLAALGVVLRWLHRKPSIVDVLGIATF